jgi:hypothetical protein
MTGRTRWIVSVALVATAVVTRRAGAGQPAASSSPAGRPAGSVFATNWTRAEYWHFFEPPPGGGDPTYGDVANRLQVGLRRPGRRADLLVAFQYVQFGGLPANASGPGPLGVGALYFEHSGRRDSRQLYLRYLTVRLRDLAPGVTLQVGRMGYTSGAEASSGQAKIEAVKRQRVDSRMIGEFEWSLYQRSFDGVRLDWDRPAWHGSIAAFRPTQGGYEDAAGVTIDRIDVLASTLTLRPGRPWPRTDWQLFVYRYLDRRWVTARPDNTGLGAARVDVELLTFGTTLVGAYPLGGGETDLLVWLAGQTGSWYELAHRAYAVALEAGHQWARAPGRPWVRAGWLRSSGDEDPADGRHGTFFQMLPTVRKYSLSATYSQMNLVDIFGQIWIAPTARTTVRVDVHRLALATAADRWYAGSGATQEEGTIFGYAGRLSRGATRLGTVAEGSVDVRLTRRWSINGYLGIVRGGEVVRRSFAGRWLGFGYLENVVQF